MTQQGTIKTRKRIDGGKSHLITCRDKAGRQHSETVRGEKAAARSRLKEMVREMEATSPSALSTVNGWLDHWLDVHTSGLKAASVKRYRQYLSHVRNAVGNERLQSLNPNDVKRLYNDLIKGGMSVRTANAVVGTFRTVLADAMDEGLISDNAAVKVKLNKPSKKTAKSLTQDQLRRLLEALEGGVNGSSAEARYLYAIAAVAAHTGLRRGEIIGLKWRDINIKSLTLEVTSSKTDAGIRVVKINPQLAAILRKHEVGLASVNTGLTRPDAPVFPGVDGERLSHKFGEVARRLDMPKGCTLHWLRHTHATLLLGENIPLAAVAARLGHADPSVTLRTYTHALPGQQAEAAAAMETILMGVN